MNIEAQKTLSMVLALVLILGLVGMPNAAIHAGCAGACCVRYDVQTPQDSAEPMNISHARSCCCGAKAARCDAFQDCVSAFPHLVFFVVPRTIDPAPAGMALTTPNLLYSFDSRRGLTNKVLSLGMDLPVPLFLLNVSLLC